MELTTDLFTYARYSGILTIVCFVIAIMSFIFGWQFRFRLVGVTSFMVVLTAGIFALGLGFFPHETIPGAARYSLIYDNGANLAVVSVSPEIDRSEIEPTLKQAATDLYSYGRTGNNGDNSFTIRLKTILHPQTGLSQPLYLGVARRSLTSRQDDNLKIELFPNNIQQLSS